MRILVCTNAYPPAFIGGAELIAHYQAKVLKQYGHEITIFTGEGNLGGVRYSLRKETYDGLPVYRVSLLPEDYQSDFINFHHRRVEEHFKTVLDNFRPDVVHMHNLIGLSVGLIHAAKQRGIRTFLTVHDHWGFCFKNTLIGRNGEICQNYTDCERCMPFVQDGDGKGIPIQMRKDFLTIQLRELDRFISPSRYLANAYIEAGIPEDRIRVIGYGIDVQRFARISRTPGNGVIRFSFIGYLGEHKGVDKILDAFSFINDKDRMRINIVGVGDQMDHYMQRCKGWGDRIKFWGRINNHQIEKIYRETDVLILPSIWPENQPVTITEAMAARTPVIASCIGGIPELVTDGETGYLFEAGNANQLAERMEEFISYPERVRIFGENAFRKIRNNTFENQVERILRAYEEGSQKPDNLYNEPLIACVGNHVESECAHVMNLLQEEAGRGSYRFVMGDWIDEDRVNEAKLVWAVDNAASIENIIIGLQNSLPLLVPEENARLKNLCRSANCGLYFSNAVEAEACIRYLTDNEAVAHAMGENGYEFFLRKGLR